MAPEQTEAEFSQAVIDTARMFSYRVAHFRPARTKKGWRTPVAADGAGFPDLVLVGRGRVIFAELKAKRGKLRPEQEAWLEALRAAGAQAYVWKPDDWAQIVETLTGLPAKATSVGQFWASDPPAGAFSSGRERLASENEDRVGTGRNPTPEAGFGLDRRRG